jgi:hypothetical protein
VVSTIEAFLGSTIGFNASVTFVTKPLKRPVSATADDLTVKGKIAKEVWTIFSALILYVL